MSMKQIALGCGAVASLLAWQVATADAQQVGVTSAVNPTAQGTPPGGLPTEILRLGSNIARNERIATSADGLTQVLFNDGSNLSIGANAEITIDEYVYNPDQGTGRMAVSLTRGVFQLAGGRILSTSPVNITTPTGTIGIRGAVGLFSAGADGAMTAAMVYGKEMTVSGQSGPPQTVTQPNFAITVPGPGLPASPPVFLTTQLLTALSGALAPPPGSSGGAAAKPTEQSVQESGGGLTKVVTTPLATASSASSVGLTANGPATSQLQSVAQSVSQTQAITQASTQAVSQSVTSPLTATALLSNLLQLFGSSSSGISVLFSRIHGNQTSATGTINGGSVTITANGQTFSQLLSQQSGTVVVAGQAFTLATSAPTLRQMDNFPSSTQTLSTTIAGNLLQLIVNNSLKSIRATNVVTGTIAGIPYSVSLPAGSKFGSTPSSTPVTFSLNGAVVFSGQLIKLNTGFKP
jgi:hypothetical protein